MSRASVILSRLRCLGPQSDVWIVSGHYADSSEVHDVQLELGALKRGETVADVPLPPCPDCQSSALSAFEAEYVPGLRRCGACGSMFTVGVLLEREPAALRRVKRGDGSNAVYRIPVGGHWAPLTSAADVATHGVLVAQRDRGALLWLTAEGWPATPRQVATFDLLPVLEQPDEPPPTLTLVE